MNRRLMRCGASMIAGLAVLVRAVGGAPAGGNAAPPTVPKPDARSRPRNRRVDSASLP